MGTNIFLEKYRKKDSTNISGGLNVEFKGRRKLLPLNDISEVVNQNEVYLDERERCSIVRLTCQVNPICSNVLFNRITEVVKNEGSSGVTFLNYGVSGDDENCFTDVLFKPNEGEKAMRFWSGSTIGYQPTDSTTSGILTPRNLNIENFLFNNESFHSIYSVTTLTKSNHITNAIRDTQLSRNVGNGNFVYHCGLDFLNNHLVRSNTFKTICKLPNDVTTAYTAFNTIADLMRDVDGRKVVEKLYFPLSERSMHDQYTKLVVMHLYEYDDILSFNDCIKKRLIKNYNGWVGLYNKSKIKSYEVFDEDESLEMERPLMYINGGDFIDMYPSRDLYSFVPKYNGYRRRLEKNWNYCLTYPSANFTPSSSTDVFSDIFETNDGINSLKAIYFSENTRSDNGVSQIVIYSIAKHGLSEGDYVNIYKTYDTTEYWVNITIDGKTSRVTNKFDTEEEMLIELASLMCDDPFKVGSGNYSSGSTNVTANKLVIEGGEVKNVVDDFIFTLFSSDIQISKNWVQLTETDKMNCKVKIDRGDRGDREETFSGNTNDGCEYFVNTTDTSDDNKYFVVGGEYVNFDKDAQRISYKKNVGGVECDYYIRIFSKIPNFKFASADTSNEYEIYKDNARLIKEYQDIEYDFESHVSRLAFARNSYNDEIGEIVFTDDIDLANLHDNLGRPLTDIYLTIVKNNKGYKEWYGFDYDDDDWSVERISADTVEYSHCFGAISCGLETSYESAADDKVQSIYRITSSDIGSSGYSVSRINGERGYGGIAIKNNEIWFDIDKNYYGDLCCYDGYNAIEKHIQYVNHRFNTAQRESSESESKKYFKEYFYDEIVADDYDKGCNKYEIKTIESNTCNSLCEGYYYVPHYKIPIRTLGQMETTMPDFLSIRQMRKSEDGIYKFSTLEKHFLSIGDKAKLYDTIQDRYYDLVTINGEDDNYNVFTCEVYDEETHEKVNITYLDTDVDYLSTRVSIGLMDVYSFKLFKMDNLGIPSYATIIRDGTCGLVWRNVLNNGFGNDTSIEEYPFTNGAFYVNKKVDLFVRRQDPYGYYGLYDETDIFGNSMDISTEDNYIKEADIEC